MGRRLEKIEKEMGYCDIKLEKERRLRKQIEFLDSDIESIDQLIRALSTYTAKIGRLGPREIHEKPSQEVFQAAGLLSIYDEKRGLLERERDDLLSKLSHYSGFVEKKRLLEDEKRSMLRSLPSHRGSKLRQLSDEFKKVERHWNELSEDLINLDEGIFFLERNLDYLKSCRNHLIAAKGDHDLESWRQLGQLSDLFRHTNIGRAVEMADGSDRNLEFAQKELVCVATFRVRTEGFDRVLVPFMDALFGDLFVDERLHRAIELIESALGKNMKNLDQVKAKRFQYAEKLEEMEKARNQLFSRMGSGRQRELAR